MKRSEILKDLKLHRDDLKDVGVPAVASSMEPLLDRLLRTFTDEAISSHGTRFNRYESLVMFRDTLRGGEHAA